MNLHATLKINFNRGNDIPLKPRLTKYSYILDFFI